MNFLQGLKDSVNSMGGSMVGSSSHSEGDHSVAALMKHNPEMVGYLTKQGGLVKSWRRRYCILKGNTMYYFADRKDRSPVGMINVDGATVQTAGKITGKNNSFELQTKDRVYYFYADTEKQRQDWITALHRAANLSRQIRASSPAILQSPPSAAEVAPRREASFTKFLHTITDLKESTSQPKEAPPPVIHVEPPQTDSAEEVVVHPFLRHATQWLITTNGVSTKGIFRIAGNSTEVLALRDSVQKTGDADLTGVDPHSVASVLKMFLREQEPTIPYNLFNKYVNAAETATNEEEQWNKLQVVLKEMPTANKERLLVILELLYAVEVRHKANGMGRAELAIIAGPLIAADVDLPCYFVHLVSNARILLYYAHFMLTSRLAK